MGHYTLTRRIAATPAEVYRAFVEPDLVVDWMDLAEIRDATGSLDAVGTRFQLVVRGPWRFRTEVLSAAPPFRHELTGRGPLGSSFHNTAVLADTTHGTDLALTTEYALPFGPIGRLIDRVYLERQPRTIANRELDRLVELVSSRRSQDSA